MSDNWSVIKEEVSTYRSYVKKLPRKAADKASFCFLLTKEEMDRLLSLNGDGGLHAVRIYLGGEMIEGHLVPTVHVVACQKDGKQYNDFNVPKTLADAPVKQMQFAKAATTTGGDSTGILPPCPAACSNQNILNT